MNGRSFLVSKKTKSFQIITNIDYQEDMNIQCNRNPWRQLCNRRNRHPILDSLKRKEFEILSIFSQLWEIEIFLPKAQTVMLTNKISSNVNWASKPCRVTLVTAGCSAMFIVWGSVLPHFICCREIYFWIIQ